MMTIKTKIPAVLLMMICWLFAASLAYGSDLKRTTVQVEQMRCSSCLRVIDGELRKVPGVIGMTAIFKNRQVVVDHEETVAANGIADIITGLGYPAAVVESQAITGAEAYRFQRAGFGAGVGGCNPGGASTVAEAWKEIRRRLFRQ